MWDSKRQIACTSTTTFPLLPAHLNEDPHVLHVFSMPLVKGFQELQAVAGGAHIHLNNIKSVWDINVLQRILSARQITARSNWGLLTWKTKNIICIKTSVSLHISFLRSLDHTVNLHLLILWSTGSSSHCYNRLLHKELTSLILNFNEMLSKFSR